MNKLYIVLIVAAAAVTLAAANGYKKGPYHGHGQDGEQGLEHGQHGQHGHHGKHGQYGQHGHHGHHGKHGHHGHRRHHERCQELLRELESFGYRCHRGHGSSGRSVGGVGGAAGIFGAGQMRNRESDLEFGDDQRLKSNQGNELEFEDNASANHVKSGHNSHKTHNKVLDSGSDDSSSYFEGDNAQKGTRFGVENHNDLELDRDVDLGVHNSEQDSEGVFGAGAVGGAGFAN